MSRNVRVVIADDSPFICRLLTSYLHSSPGLEVVGIAHDGTRAVQLVREREPDVVTLDIDMPVMNGLEALDNIMKIRPVPTVMLSGVGRTAAITTRQALGLGAVDFILKYSPGVDIDPDELRCEIVEKVWAASRVGVVRPIRKRSRVQVPQGDVASSQEKLPWLIVIGASTGGPLAIRGLLAEIPQNIPAAIIVVQHIPANFTSVLATQLQRYVELDVREARSGELIRAATVYLAPGDFHLLVSPNGRIQLNKGIKINGHRPSVDVTMQSAAQAFGHRTLAAVLTGMGQDGAMGMRAIRDRRGRTFAQNAQSCVVNGMPQQCIDAGVAEFVASPSEIGNTATRIIRQAALVGCSPRGTS